MKFDPTMTVPPDVAQAADKVAAYFENRGITDWRLGGVASRIQLEQAEADRAAFEAAGEYARERLGIRMEELQQAVQARLAAEKQVAQLLGALEGVTLTQDEIDLGISAVAERHAHALAVIASVKGGVQ